MKDNKNISINKEEIKESIQSTNTDNQTTKENKSINMNVIIEEKKPKSRKKDRKNSLLKLINKDIPLFEIMKLREKDLKNYDKISFEFNKLFKLYKLQKKAKENKTNFDSIINKGKSDKKIHKEKPSNKKNKNINLNEVIKRLEVPKELRTMKDIYIIRKYLKTTQVGRLFQNEIKPKGMLYNKLLTFLSFQMKFKKIKKGEILFKIGSRTDYFYLIMEGSIEILKPMSKFLKISGYEYFLQLMNYRKKNEKYLYSLCIKENLRNYEIKTKDADLIPYIFITYKLDEIKNKYFVDFKAVLDLVNVTPEELGLELDKIHSNGYIFNKIKMIKLRMPIITQHELNIYRFLDDKVNKKQVILFQNEPFLKIGKNSYVGEASFSGKGVRNGTAKIVDDCYFGYLDIQLYNLNFYEEKKAIFDKKVNFLYNNFFFGKISLRKFETQFFNWFLSEEYCNNDLIFKENSPCQFIYFIEEGAIELDSTRTILEIQVLLENLEEKRLSMNEKGEKLDYNILNNDWFDIENHVNKNQTNKILILGKNDILGLESFYYQIPFLTNARVITPKAKIVKIDNEHLYQILIRSSDIMHELESTVHNKMKIITKRFFSLNNVKLMLIDDKISREEKLKYENHLKEKIKDSKFRINSPFPEQKLNILQKINIDEITRRRNKLLTSMGRAGSTKNFTNLYEEPSERGKNKDKPKGNKPEEKKKYIYNFYSFLPNFEDQIKNKRKMMNSAGVKNIKDQSFDNKNLDSTVIEDNLLKKVRNELKILKENKYFLTKINTEEYEQKGDETDKEDENIFSRELFLRKRKENKLNKDNSINDSKDKDDIKEKVEPFTFITKFEEKKSNLKIFDENTKDIISSILSDNNTNINSKREEYTKLPSIIKPFNNKNSFKNLSIISRKNNASCISINNANKLSKNLNINFGYNKHLIKSYSFVNKKSYNNMKIQQEINAFDPKEKYNIFNENNFYKNEIYSNMLKKNKSKGLNEFGFPLKASNSFIPRALKRNDLNIKIKKYQEYRKRLQRKIEERNEIL